MKTKVIVGIVLLLFGGILSFKVIMYFIVKQYMVNFSMPPAVVSAEKVSLEDFQPSFSAIAQLSAPNQVELTSQVSGMIVESLVNSGAKLKAGDPILVLDHSVLDGQLKNAQASLALAKLEYERQQKLYAADAVSKDSLDQAKATLDEDEGIVQSDTAEISQHTIRAPFDGQLGLMPTSLGQYVNPGDNLGTFVDASTLFVDFPVTQQELHELSPGTQFILTTDAYPRVEFKDQVHYLDSAFSPQTYSIMARGVLANTDPKHPLYPGMMVKVKILLPPLPQAVVVPQEAIVSTLYGDSVFVVNQIMGKDQKPETVAKIVYITLGPSEGSQTVVLSGLKSGDEVVTSGQMKLQDQSPIIVQS